MSPRRLQRSRDIRDVFSARNVAHGRVMTVHAAWRPAASVQGNPRHGNEQARVAVVAGKDVGGSVQRNRAKRRLRAAL
ncbi:MAG: ribonuclease P protein component, partial [Pseudonocardiaceae bacterium]